MDIIMPQLGETVAEGKIATWFKAVGDTVAAGDNLFEIETDKVTMEVQATAGGVLAEIRVAAGETVPVGTVIAVVGEAASKRPPAPRAAPTPAPAPAPAAKPAAAPTPARAPQKTSNGAAAAPVALQPFAEVRTPTESFGTAEAPLGLKITPLARRLVRQGGLDLDAIAYGVRERGGWRIAAADVKAHAEARPAAVVPESAAAPALAARDDDVIEPLNRIRARTASHLAEAWRTAPHVFQAVEVDFSGIERARQAAKADFAARHGGALTFLPFVARALCLALGKFPRLNAAFDRDRLLLHHDINLGIAVDLDQDGLIVPVLHHADEMTVAGLAKAMARQVDKARAGRLTPGDVADGTYSISNNGSFGTLMTTPIINLPQVAILSLDAVRKRPVVVETAAGDAIAVRPVAMLGQSFDHRAVDGAYSAAFLRELKSVIESRDWPAELA